MREKLCSAIYGPLIKKMDDVLGIIKKNVSKNLLQLQHCNNIQKISNSIIILF